MSRFRAFTFTINNYTSEDESSLLNLGHRYIVYGREIGESGTPHLQGYICFRDGRTFRSLKSKMPRAHIEQAKGDSDANFKYCTKDGDFVEDGDRPASVKEKGVKAGEAEKNRWTEARNAARNGEFGLIPDDLHTRFDKYYEREFKRAKPTPSALPHTARHFWVYGSTGTGKSYSARMVGQHLGWRTFVKCAESKWWDMYDGEELVIIDDFDKYQVRDGGNMKRWLDIYPVPVQTKGGMMTIRPKCIIVTSNYSPDEIWQDSQTLAPIERRVNLLQLHTGPFAVKPEDFAITLADMIKTQHSLCTKVVKEGERHGDVPLEDTV